MAVGESKRDPAGHESKVTDDKATGDAKVEAPTQTAVPQPLPVYVALEPLH